VASRGPEAIDLVPDSGPLAGETIRGLYRLEADRLVLCLAAPGRDRPNEFAADEGSEQVLVTLRRE
jgi:uncharacterized protein (TIGR03067 family)